MFVLPCGSEKAQHELCGNISFVGMVKGDFSGGSRPNIRPEEKVVFLFLFFYLNVALA